MLMPDFCHPHYGFRHSIDSALDSLSRLGIVLARVSIVMEGPGLPDRWITKQEPQPGEELSSAHGILLTVAGRGYFHDLPVGMWDRGGDTEPGTREIVEIFDDPLQKAAHAIRDGTKQYALHPDNLDACARWISLFGLNPEDWPRNRWYSLALLLPTLHRVAGLKKGIVLGLELLLNLPVLEIRRRPRFLRLPEPELSSLARRYCALGIDYILGDRLEDVAHSEIVIGPVTLDSYRYFNGLDGRRLLDSVCTLLMPSDQEFSISWTVLDPQRTTKLNDVKGNAWLGLNSYLIYPPEVEQSVSSGA